MTSWWTITPEAVLYVQYSCCFSMTTSGEWFFFLPRITVPAFLKPSCKLCSSFCSLTISSEVTCSPRVVGTFNLLGTRGVCFPLSRFYERVFMVGNHQIHFLLRLLQRYTLSLLLRIPTFGALIVFQVELGILIEVRIVHRWSLRNVTGYHVQYRYVHHLIHNLPAIELSFNSYS